MKLLFGMILVVVIILVVVKMIIKPFQLAYMDTHPHINPMSRNLLNILCDKLNVNDDRYGTYVKCVHRMNETENPY